MVSSDSAAGRYLQWKEISIARFIYASLCKIQGLFKDFLKTFLLFSRSENLYKILIYTLKYIFGSVGLLYLKY